MQKKTVDIVAPFEEETLFSWIVRMANYYGYKQEESKKIMNILFGEKAIGYPRIFFEPYLSELVENVNLPDSEYFSDEQTILNKMTVFSFYAAFLDEKLRLNYLDRFTREDKGNVKYLHEKMPGLQMKNYHSNKRQSDIGFKYCPVCMKENRKYLIREHFIHENRICFIHKAYLDFVPYAESWTKLNFLEYDLYSKNIRYVEDEEGEIYYHISKMIHEIFQNGFLENVLRMKVLFQRKLKECGYLSKENEWYQFEDFYKTKKMFFYFKSIDEARRVLNHIIFTIGEIVNPVLYLFMIERLFGSLSGFYEYSSNEAEIKNNEVFYVSSKIYDKISNEYIGMVNKECIRKEIMGTKKKGRRRYFPVSYNKCLDECEYLSYEGVSVNKIFLNRQEYANKMHKSKALIALLCRKGKIHGAFKNNGAWRIPEDAPYPKDGRCRK